MSEEPVFFIKHKFHRAVEWGKRNRDTLLTGLLIAAFAFLGVVLYKQHESRKAAEAWGLISTAQDVAELERAAATYAGTPAGPFLLLRLGSTYVISGESEKALAVYGRAASESSGELALAAWFGTAMALESSGRFEQAGEALESLAAEDGFWGARARQSLEGLPGREAAYRQLEAEAARVKAAEAKAAEEAKAAQDLLMGFQPDDTAEGTMESAQADEIKEVVSQSGEDITGEPASEGNLDNE